MQRSRTLVLVVGTALVAGSAAAQDGQERGPVSQETLRPLTVSRSAAQPKRAARAPGFERARMMPLRTPWGLANSPQSLMLKRRASVDPRVQAPDQILDFSGPATQSAARVTASFRGFNTAEAAIGNSFFVPPDPQVAASSLRVVHAVNLALRLFRRDGSRLQTIDMNDFFDAPLGPDGVTMFTDPKVIFDANATHRRFYVAVLESNIFTGAPPPNFATIHLAVSRSANPSNLNPSNWCFYKINALQDRGTDLESFPDFPALGAGANALVITSNQFSFQVGFVRSAIRVLRKVPLSDNAEHCPSPRLFTFAASEEVGDFTAFTVQPVQQLKSPSSFSGTSKPTYLISSTLAQAVGFVPSRDYHVYRLRNVASSPTISRTTVTGNFAYIVPPRVPQDNEARTIDTGPEWILEAAGVRDAFWATHATACSFPSGNVSCVRVIRLRVGQSGSGALRASITQQKTFGAPNEFLFEPGIAVNRDETVAVPFHFASPARTHNNLSTWFVVKSLGESDYRPFRPLATGQCQQEFDRTGDYSGAETDPVDSRSFWLSGEQAKRSVIRGLCLWETRIIRVTPAAPAALVAAKGTSPE